MSSQTSDIRNIKIEGAIVTWLWVIPLVYLAFFLIFRQSKSLYNRFTKKGSRLSDVLAYEFTSFLAVTYLALAGVVAWFELFGVDISDAKAQPLFGRSDFITDHIISLLAAYQGWNCILCLILRELRTVQMLSHHVFALVLAVCAMDSFLNYWTIYFFGITELSSIPLSGITILTHLLGKEKENHPLYKFSKMSFAFSFTVVRIVFWTPYFVHCIQQSFKHYFSGELYPPYFFIFTSISSLLTVLQYMWFGKIIKNLLRPKSADKVN